MATHDYSDKMAPTSSTRLDGGPSRVAQGSHGDLFTNQKFTLSFNYFICIFFHAPPLPWVDGLGFGVVRGRGRVPLGLHVLHPWYPRGTRGPGDRHLHALGHCLGCVLRTTHLLPETS